jgi:hypothetical protein
MVMVKDYNYIPVIEKRGCLLRIPTVAERKK